MYVRTSFAVRWSTTKNERENPKKKKSNRYLVNNWRKGGSSASNVPFVCVCVCGKGVHRD